MKTWLKIFLENFDFQKFPEQAEISANVLKPEISQKEFFYGVTELLENYQYR